MFLVEWQELREDRIVLVTAKKQLVNALKTSSTNPLIVCFPNNWQLNSFPCFVENVFKLQKTDFLSLKFE